MSIQHPNRNRQSGQASGIDLTVRDVYEGDSVGELIPPELVVIPKEDEVVLKEVDANADTWIRADSTINIEDKR